MLTRRDREILTFIEDYKSITLNQAQYIFFNGNYECARRRLKQLENMNFIKSLPNALLNSKTYFNIKLLKDHDLLTIEFISSIKKLGANIIEFKTQPTYLDKKIRPDAKIVFEYNDNVYFVLLEVDLHHYTSNSKMQRYEELYKSGELQEECYGTFPIIVISRPTTGIRYNSNNFNTVYTDIYYNSIERLLFNI